jgi:hypothetical protein
MAVHKREGITGKDITVTHHAVDGYMLSCMYNGIRYHKRYMDYPVREAKRLFKEYVFKQAFKSGE